VFWKEFEIGSLAITRSFYCSKKTLKLITTYLRHGRKDQWKLSEVIDCHIGNHINILIKLLLQVLFGNKNKNENLLWRVFSYIHRKPKSWRKSLHLKRAGLCEPSGCKPYKCFDISSFFLWPPKFNSLNIICEWSVNSMFVSCM
jgi:hypothetical protein